MTSIHRNLVLALTLLVSIVSCKTVKTIPVETVKTSVRHDTLIMNHQWYDSIYVFQDRYIDRSRDTILIKEFNTEYRYRLLRDTLYKTKIVLQRDSIPYEVKVVEVKEVKGTCAEHSRSIPWYCKCLAWIGAFSIILLILYITIKLTKQNV